VIVRFFSPRAAASARVGRGTSLARKARASSKGTIMIRKLSFVLSVLTLVGCGAPVDGEFTDVEPVAEDEEAVQEQFAVGVIPIDDYTCPNERSDNSIQAQRVVITLDDEDSNNKSYKSGWVIPQTTSPSFANVSNTGVRVCKVDGRQFFPRSTSTGDIAQHYAVLSLGLECPNGSQRVQYRIDTQDPARYNNITGPGAPNTVDNYNAYLYFCVFRGGSNAAQFPNLGRAYGVYHNFDIQYQPSWAWYKRLQISDSEDTNNKNAVLSGDAAAVADLARIIKMSKYEVQFAAAHVPFPPQ
jgi:hypothetical protein